MNFKKIIHCWEKINFHITLIGLRIKLIAVLSFGWVREKPITLQRKSVGNAGSVNLLLPVLQTPAPAAHQARELKD